MPTSLFAETGLSGIWGPFFASTTPQKVALISRAPKEIESETKEMETLIREGMYESGRFSLVKDGRDFEDKSDPREILASQDFAFLCFLDGHIAPKQTRFELRCFRKEDESRLSFVGTRQDLNGFMASRIYVEEKKIPELSIDNTEESSSEKRSELGEKVFEKSQLLATQKADDTRLYFDPTRKNLRRILIGLERRRLDHAEFYKLTGAPELKEKYLSTGKVRTTLFIAGSAAIALGAGLIFGGAISNAKCGVDEACKSNLLTILGGSTLGLGMISISTGFLINRYPSSSEEDIKAIDLYNRSPKEED